MVSRLLMLGLREREEVGVLGDEEELDDGYMGSFTR
jgi:hypothetical protein